MSEWNNLIKTIKKLSGEVNIALVGKYVQLQDAYLSINEALKHAGYKYGKKININWILADDVTEDNIENYLKDCDGILVPGGFGPRGIDGKIQAIKFAREMIFLFRNLSRYATCDHRVCKKCFGNKRCRFNRIM